jgi:hypothetical protein
MDIRMSDGERALFEALLKPSRSYLEFGAGGSTVLAHSVGVGQVVAVDSSLDWLKQVGAAVARSPSVRLFHADIGPTGAWGYPMSEDYKSAYGHYHSSIWEVFTPSSFDLVLVDGRFRIACFAAAIQRVRPDALVAVHDYRSRPHYHPIEAIGRRVAECEELTVFAPLAHRREEAGIMAAQYADDPR